MDQLAIGVDIGGTTTKLVLANQAGVVLERESFPTPKNSDPDLVVHGLVDRTRQFRDRVAGGGARIEGFGFAIPHFFDGEDWVQRQTNNMPGLEGYLLRPVLAEAFGSNIALINDVSGAGIAEYMFGRGRGVGRMFLMAIGTGVGASLLTEEQGLVHFSWDSIGDSGMIIVDPSGQAGCTCGGRGCLEALVSGPAIRRRAMSEVERGKTTLLSSVKDAKGVIEAVDVSAAAQAGDAVAKDIMEEAGFYLGVALTSYLHLFRPTLIVLAGGVSKAGELLIDPALRTIRRLSSPWYLERLHGIVLTGLGNEAAAIGCASLILYPGRYLR